jgi:aspartyl-tRNA(Asn)/glutamyl-tRNA(Gln) amidotransferase subunit B
VVIQETRGFDQERVETFTLRTKEDAPDYRYMPDPNIPPLRITEVYEPIMRIPNVHRHQGQIAKVKALLPELPHQTSNRLRSLGLTEREIEVLLNADAVKAINCDGERNFGAVSYFDEASLGRDPKTVANWYRPVRLGFRI